MHIVVKKVDCSTIRAFFVNSVTSAILRWLLLTGAVGAVSAKSFEPCHDISRNKVEIRRIN
jgi:hypothetical protein